MILAGLLLAGCQLYPSQENRMTEPVAMSPRLQALFAKTKQVCFGRYVMEIPAEADLLWGFQEFPGKIITHVGAAGRLKEAADAYRAKVLATNKTAEITYYGRGATENSLEVRSFESKNAKIYGVEAAMTFVATGPHLFEWFYGGEELAPLVRGIRARDPDEIPTQPGVCIDHGFVADATGSFQEIFGAGIHLPSFPDVSFSMMSNKNASTEGDPGLIERHYQVMGKDSSSIGPGISRLRIGKREVNGWNGEQVLLRRNGNEGAFAHEFLWASVGKTGSALNPASVDIQFNTGVKANRTLAQSPSLSDEEALALWDRLLLGVRFRVDAPPTQTGAPVTVRSGEITPLTEPVAMSPRLQALFAKTKQVCFGRYVMEVPAEAELLWGFQEFPGKIIAHVGAAGRLKEMAEAYRAKVLAAKKTAEITYYGPGPTSNSAQVRYFKSDTAKQYGNEGGYTFVTAGPHLFEWSGARTIAEVVPKLRARDPDEIPTQPGVCIDHGFVADATGSFQEIFGAGIRLPSLPDVSFSVDSNKLATGAGDGLLASIAEQRKYLGNRYPKLTTLREGKRSIGVWQGEESLVRRADGTHDFEWEAVARERTTLHPAVLGAKMYTKVAANRIGAADQASLTDEEAIALWDRLLMGVRFRVDAPPTQTGAPVTVRSGGIPHLDGPAPHSTRGAGQ